jgi:predicted Zn-dependent peptidase
MATITPVEKTVFPNGIRLILIPIDHVDSVATAVMVGVGSRYETPEINGISHFLEHMVFKGTQKYPTTDDVNEIERIGGIQNAYTDIDITNYHNKVLATDWKLSLEINKELATKPRLEQQYVDKERDVILEEMKRYEDEPAAKVDEAFHTMMYPGTKLGMRIIGEKDSLIHTTSKELKSYHDAWYRPDRIVISVAGNVASNSEKITKAVRDWFTFPAGFEHSGKMEKVVDSQDAPKMKVVTKPDAQQAHLMLGVRSFDRHNEDRYAWNVFNLLMGISFTSRLFKEIREKRGLCYHIHSANNSWEDVGYWSIYAGVATEKVNEAVSGIILELTKAVASGVTHSEIAIAKKRLKTMLAFKSEDPEFLTEWYGRQELYGQKPVMTLAEYFEKIDAVKKDEIDGLIRKYLVTKNLNLALVWNKKEDASLTKKLVIS